MVRYFAIGVGLLALSGCDSLTSVVGGKVDCLNSDGHATAISVVKAEAEKKLAEATDDEGNKFLSKSKIRAALEQVKIAFEDVRTSKEDPNSTKKFCVGKIKLTFPTDMIADADVTSSLVENPSISEYAENLGFERSANSFSLDLDFNVQPTDDGEKIYAEIEDGDNAYELLAAIVGGQALRKKVEQYQMAEQKMLEEQSREQEAALREQREANLGEAKAQSQLADQTINAVWQSIAPEQRDQLLPLQRAWIKRKAADCKIEASSASTEPMEREGARLKCEARLNNERAQELSRYAYEGDY